MKNKSSEDKFDKGSESRSAFSVKNATIALLIGGAALLGTYMIQSNQTVQETATVETTALGVQDKDKFEINGVADQNDEYIQG